MRFELFVAIRYLVARRKQTVVSFVTLISTGGVTAGVAALIIALALNGGFQQEFQKRILGATSHINLLRTGNLAITGYQQLSDRLSRIPGVESVSPTVYGQAQLSSDLNRQQPAVLRGVDPEREGILKELLQKVVEGDAGRFGGREALPSIMLGVELSRQLGVLVGDRVKALGLQGELSPLGRMPRTRTFEVVAIFESGLWEYDASWALIPLRAAQRFTGLSPGEVSALEFRIQNVDQAPELARRIRKTAGKGYLVHTWIELNRPLFSALKLEKLALFIAISLIVLVASLNIVSTLTMMVMEKNRDIAIITAMGGTTRTVMRIFVLQGLVIGLVGTLLGDLLGTALSWYLDAYRVIALQPEVYSIPYVPFRSSLSDLLLISVTALAVSLLATLYPAQAAARLDPVEALRHE